MSPYVPHEFDVTRHVKAGDNSLEVAIADLAPEPGGAGKDEIELGINPGWEGYGGIIRDVYLEIRSAAFVDNVHLTYDFTPEFAKAMCKVAVDLSSSSPGQGKVGVSLLRDSTEIARAEKEVDLRPGNTEAELSFDLTNPALWSPEQPNLYQLLVTLQSPTGTDQFSCNTGFRKIEVRGRRFYLNGARLQLHGLSWLGAVEGPGLYFNPPADCPGHAGHQGDGGEFCAAAPVPPRPLCCGNGRPSGPAGVGGAGLLAGRFQDDAALHD